jgi:hypothetical protein
LQLRSVILPGPHNAIPADFALPRLKPALTSMSDIDHALVSDSVSCKNGTATASVQIMLRALRA